MISKYEFFRAFRMGYIRGADYGLSGKYDPQHLEKLDLKIVDKKAEEAFKVRVLQINENNMDWIEEFYK